MIDREQFQLKLQDLLRVAQEQNMRMEFTAIQEFFAEDALTQEQLELVCEYLLSQKVTVIRIEDFLMEEESIEQLEKKLSPQEQAYLKEYRSEIEHIIPLSKEEERLKYFLPLVVKEALKRYEPSMYLGDLIQEGSMSLMMAFALHADAPVVDEVILKEVRAGIDAAIMEQQEIKHMDERMVKKVEELDATLKLLEEELGRKPDIEEVAERMNLTLEELEDILMLAGENTKEE